MPAGETFQLHHVFRIAMNRMQFPVCLFLSIVFTHQTALAILPTLFQDKDSIDLKNGSFSEWQDGLPTGWTVITGATNGADSPKSIVRQGPGPSLELSGNANTNVWLAVSQAIKVQHGQTVRIKYSASASGILREKNQNDNCYVGLFFKDSRGNRLPPNFWPVNSEALQEYSLTLRIPDKVASADVMIFLSKTGTLNVRDVSLETLEPADSFDILVADMARNYSFFDLKKTDWNEMTGRYRERATSADEPNKFTRVITEMLGELKDPHIWIDSNGKRVPSYRSGSIPNFDRKAVEKDLKSTEQIGDLGIVGTTKDGFVYLRIDSLNNISNDQLKSMVGEIEKKLDAPGYIVDLRTNGGGDERVAQAIAGMFTREELVYAQQKFRNGDRPDDFGEKVTRVLRPTSKNAFTGAVVCLIGPGAVSSGEGMAMMMKALPNCTLVGQSTRGASGNPQPVQLPNGIDVWYSRWVSMLPDGTPIEGTGVPPEITVEHVAGTDPTWTKAIEILREKTKSE